MINPPNKHLQATIEHIIPCVLGGSFLDRNNMAISCCRCNNERQTADFYLFREYKKGIIKCAPNGSAKTLIKKNLKTFNKFDNDRIIYQRKHKGELSFKEKYVYSI